MTSDGFWAPVSHFSHTLLILLSNSTFNSIMGYIPKAKTTAFFKF